MTLTQLTVEDVRNFEATYKGSTEEIDDLKSIYVDCEGDLDLIHERHLCSSIDDEPRLRFGLYLQRNLTPGQGLTVRLVSEKFCKTPSITEKFPHLIISRRNQNQNATNALDVSSEKPAKRVNLKRS